MLNPNRSFGQALQGDPVLQRSGRSAGVDWIGARGRYEGAVHEIRLRVTVPRRFEALALFSGSKHKEATP